MLHARYELKVFKLSTELKVVRIRSKRAPAVCEEYEPAGPEATRSGP